MNVINITAKGMTSLFAVLAMTMILASAFYGINLAGASSSPSNVVASLSVKSSCSVSAPSNTAINFGNLNPTQTYSATNAVTFTDSGGNAPANILVAGSNMISGGNNFYVTNTLWSAISGGSTTALTLYTGLASLVDTLIQIPAPSRTNPSTTNTIYFGIDIPAGTPAGIYTQNIVYGYTCNGGPATAITTNTVATANVQSACFISLNTASIDFGSLDPNANVPTANQIIDTNQGGNVASNILVEGGNWISGSNNFYVANTLWNPTSASAGTGNALALYTGLSSLVDTLIQVAAPTLSTPTTSSNIYFGMEIPGGTPAGIYTQNIVYGYSCSGGPANAITTNTVATANVQSTCFIGVSANTINFGTINPGANVPTSQLITVQDPGGNTAANVFVDGGNWISGSNNFYVTNTLWDVTSDLTYTGNALQLAPAGLTDTHITVLAPSISTPTTSNNIYFGLGIPNGAVAGAYTQNIIIENSC